MTVVYGDFKTRLQPSLFVAFCNVITTEVMDKSQPLSLLLLQLLAIATTITTANISIILTNMSNHSMSFCNYKTTVFYDERFSNIPNGGMEGFLHQPDPKDGCSYISPILSLELGTSSNDSWFAIIENYPSCMESIILDHVRNAGYKLIIASSSTGKENKTFNSKKIGTFSFPIVIVTVNYTDYLIENALSNFTSPEIKATISANVNIFMAVIVMFTVVLFTVCFLCCCLFCYCQKRRSRQYRVITGIQQQRQRNFDRLQNHDDIARRELIESILRQLQQLHLDGEVQQPLGMEQTKKLPIKKYQKLSNVETCAICVDDFKQGDTLRILPCHHFFHIKCVDEWLNNHSDLCPLCKNKVTHEGKGGELPRMRGGGNTARDPLLSFTEDEEIDEYDQLRAARTTGERYGSV